MSRRTRTKIRPKQRFSLSHHSLYALSTSHFPRSYSLLGKDVEFPSKVLPFYSRNKICFVGDSIAQFFEELDTKQIDVQKLKQVSISVKGHKYQDSTIIVNLLIFLLSMCCFCFNFVTKFNSFRNRYYPKYRFNQYQNLVQIIQMFSHVETLVINFQDNDFNSIKMNILQDSISKSRINHVVLRNMTYYMQVENMDGFFCELRRKQRLKFAFVWETKVLQSQNNIKLDEQVQPINMADDVQ